VKRQPITISEPLLRLLEARHHDPFDTLGRHFSDKGVVIRALVPGSAELAIEGSHEILPMHRLFDSDLFEWQGPAEAVAEHYRLISRDGRGNTRRFFDPYSFSPIISEYDLHLFGEGRHRNAYRFLGAKTTSIDAVSGVFFSTWAPNAERVSVVGDFNDWDGRVHPMRSRGGSGVWELFIPGLEPGELYKFELRNRDSGLVTLKTDPYGRQFEQRPNTAAIVAPKEDFPWQDGDWLEQRSQGNWLHEPISVYEVHLGSWQRGDTGDFLNYRDLAHRLVDYVTAMGYTHIQLLPITEHPLDASWGYQTTGYFAPTSRFGAPDDLRYFIDHCHRHGIGVFLDWVPAHFPRDGFALARFDGSPLYEHSDPRRGEHRDWGTLIFDYGRNEVRDFLMSSALYWLEEFHFDGLRVDAVASMLYLDYSRSAGDWIPNVHGGCENLEAIEFLKELNSVVPRQQPGALMIAEESTAWPGVSRPVDHGGLGFSVKWNMGWMNDTLEYIHREPVYRRFHHGELTFSLVYAFTENFMLPLSHDEVVHMKRSMLEKMPGDPWQQFANLRILYTYMYTVPGKKLLFMGNDIAQGKEWDHDSVLEWHVLEHGYQQGIQKTVRDLNHLYRDHPALHRHDFDAEGFEWIDPENAENSLISFIRKGGGELLLILLNFTPVPRTGFRTGAPVPGTYEAIFNSDSRHYAGGDAGDSGPLQTEHRPCNGRAHSLQLTVPPLGGVILRYTGS